MEGGTSDAQNAYLAFLWRTQRSEESATSAILRHQHQHQHQHQPRTDQSNASAILNNLFFSIFEATKINVFNLFDAASNWNELKFQSRPR